MNRRQELALRAREKRIDVETTLLNRAVRHDKGPIDRAITAAVLTQIPDVPDDQAGGGPAQRGRLDAPPGPR